MPKRLSRVLTALLLALLLADPARAEGRRAVLLDLAALDSEVPRTVVEPLGKSLNTELQRAFTAVPAAEVERLRTGVEKPPNLKVAAQAVNEAKEQLANGQVKPAAKRIAAARAFLDPLRPQLRDYTLLTTTLLYSAVVSMNIGDKRTSQAAFADLARLRPDYRIDPAEFPPAVIEAFEKARQAEAKLAKGRVIVTSTPEGAQVFVDEVVRGVTPLTVAASPGAHFVRVASEGYLSQTKSVTVAPYAKHELEATLEKNLPRAALRQLESAAVSGAAPGALSEPAALVAGAFQAEGVVVGVVALSLKGYVVSVAWLQPGAPVRVMAVEVNRSLSDAKALMTELGVAIATAPSGVPSKDGAVIAKVLGDGKPSRAPDYGKFAMGFGPGGAAAVLAEASVVRTIPMGGIPGVAEKPAVKWWVWAGIGVLVAGAAAGGTALYLATRPPDGVQFVVQRQQP